MDMDFAVPRQLVRRRCLISAFTHQRPCLLHAFFRPSVAGAPLRFANPSPPSGWVKGLSPSSFCAYSAHAAAARIGCPTVQHSMLHLTCPVEAVVFPSTPKGKY